MGQAISTSTVDETRLLTVRQVGVLLGLSSRTVWKLASAGRLPRPVRLGGSVRWRASDLVRFVEICGCDMTAFAAAVSR